jgi:hypothetical protein
MALDDITFQEEVRLMNERLERVETLLTDFIQFSSYNFNKPIKLNEGADIESNIGAGINIGMSDTEKLGFWGVAPVDQPDAIANIGSGGSDSDGAVRVQVENILNALRSVGIIKT